MSRPSRSIHVGPCVATLALSAFAGLAPGCGPGHAQDSWLWGDEYGGDAPFEDDDNSGPDGASDEGNPDSSTSGGDDGWSNDDECDVDADWGYDGYADTDANTDEDGWEEDCEVVDAFDGILLHPWNEGAWLRHEVAQSPWGTTETARLSAYELTGTPPQASACVEVIASMTGEDTCILVRTDGWNHVMPDHSWYQEMSLSSARIERESDSFDLQFVGAFGPFPSVWEGGVQVLEPTSSPVAIVVERTLPAAQTSVSTFTAAQPLGWTSPAIHEEVLPESQFRTWAWTPGDTGSPVHLNVVLGAPPEPSEGEHLVLDCWLADDGHFEMPAEYLAHAAAHVGDVVGTTGFFERVERSEAILFGVPVQVRSHWRVHWWDLALAP